MAIPVPARTSRPVAPSARLAGTPYSGTAGKPHRWTRAEYERMVEVGGFDPDLRVELVDGEVVNKMSPQGTPHSTAISCVESALRDAFGSGATVRGQMPFNADDVSVPEPDVAVIPGLIRDYLGAHPSEALLIVEVSESTLRYDRTRKAALYARCGVPDYWIVDLSHQTLIIHRRPVDGAYQWVQTLSVDDAVAPLARPDARIRVSDLLP